MRLVLLVLLTQSCVDAVDLRTHRRGSEDVVCDAGLRKNPATDECEPCEPLEPPPASVCPCAYELFDAPFPKCDQDFVCLPCQGDKTECAVFNEITGRVSSCDLFLQCCDALAADEGSTPCCPADTQVVCAKDENNGEYPVSCSGGCCLGAACPNGDFDCASWQTCDDESGHCSPACELGVDYCSVEQCTCAPIEGIPT